MVNFNGNVFSGNVVIVNGKVISGEPVKNSSAKEYDEIKKQLAEGIKRIRIDCSSVDVKLSASSKTKLIKEHLHGQVSDVDFSVSRQGDELVIRVRPNGTSINKTVVMGGCCTISNCVISGALELEVEVPAETFEEISVKSKSGDIEINSNVKADSIIISSNRGDVEIGSKVVAEFFSIQTSRGDVNLSAVFQRLNINCSSGDIEVDSNLCCNAQLAISTSSGDIDVVLEEVGKSTVFVETNSGRCKNKPKFNGRYTVSGYIKASSGDVKFH